MKPNNPPQTDTKKLAKGIKYLLGSLPLAFLGPAMVYSAFGNREHPLFLPVLILGFLFAIASAYLMFKGIRTLMHALFND